jgi:hypothetical protein
MVVDFDPPSCLLQPISAARTTAANNPQRIFRFINSFPPV